MRIESHTMVISSGLLDLQVNGFAGVDFNSGTITADELDYALEAMLKTGVTACLPTIITARPKELELRFQALDVAVKKSRLGPVMCPGYHLEGPFLNPSPGYCGCHPADAMTAADPALIKQLQDVISRPILMVTLAPEVAGALELIRILASQKVIVALGHTAANFDEIAAAVDAGACLSTHLGNGLPQTLHKLENPLFAQLSDDRLHAAFIADGIHLHPKALKSLLRAKGFYRSILVTDAVTGAGASPGRYAFAGMSIDRKTDGSVRLSNTTSLAGSALCLDQALRNLVEWGLATPHEALAMAADHPRALLEPALKARDLVLLPGRCVWNDDLTLRHVNIGSEERHISTSTAA